MVVPEVYEGRAWVWKSVCTVTSREVSYILWRVPAAVTCQQEGTSPTLALHPTLLGVSLP